MFIEQLGEGTGIDNIEDRDKESVLNNPNSNIVDYPKSQECKLLLNIFNNTPFVYGQFGITGFDYIALKDQVRWAGLKPKKYINKLLTMFNYYVRGINKKEG